MSAPSQVSHYAEYVRRFGTLFEDVTIEQAARKCARAAVAWGGEAAVYAWPDGRVLAVVPRSAQQKTMDDRFLVGTYLAIGRRVKDAEALTTRQQIAEDLWHHMQQMRAAPSKTGDACRTFGPVFESLSIESAASKCVRAAVSWGGLVSVFCDRAGMVTVVVPNTAHAVALERQRPGDLVGTYTATTCCGGVDVKNKLVGKWIAEDLWHHLQQVREAA